MKGGSSDSSKNNQVPSYDSTNETAAKDSGLNQDVVITNTTGESPGQQESTNIPATPTNIVIESDQDTTIQQAAMMPNDQEAPEDQIEEISGRVASPAKNEQVAIEHTEQSGNTEASTDKESYQDSEGISEKIDEDFGQTKKLSLFERFFPIQSITLILIVALALLFLCLIVTLIPIKSKKVDIVEYFKSIGITASINGNVYLNPFLMSYTISAANLHIKGTISDERSCTPELNLKTEQVYLGILTKNVKLLGTQIDAVTGGDSSKMYAFIKSILAGKNLVSKIETKNAVISITSCPLHPPATQLVTTQTPKTTETDKTTPDQSNISKLASLAITDFTLKKAAKEVSVNTNILLEGIPIKLSYQNDEKHKSKKILISSSFANFSYSLDIGDKGPKKNVGQYALIVSKGSDFAKVLGIKPFEQMYGVVSTTTMKIQGGLDVDEDGNVVFSNDINLSQGIGSVTGSFSPKSRFLEAKIEFPLLDFRYKDINKHTEASFGYVSFWKTILRIIKSMDHKVTFSASKVITNRDSFQELKLSYLLQKEILSPDDFYFFIKNNNFELSSVKEDNGPSNIISDDATAQIVQSAKNRRRSIVDTKTVIPMQIRGASIEKLFSTASQLFGDPNTIRSSPKEILNPKPFNGTMDFFLDYKDGDSGFQDINLIINNVGSVTGSYIFDNELNQSGIIDTITKIDLSIEKVDISDILDKNVVWDLVDPIIPKDRGSWLFNFTRNTESEKNYDIKILLQKVLYKTKKITMLDFHTIKKPRYFEIVKLEGNSEILQGNAKLVVDATSVKPVARGFADIALLNIAPFFDNTSQATETTTQKLNNVNTNLVDPDARQNSNSTAQTIIENSIQNTSIAQPILNTNTTSITEKRQEQSSAPLPILATEDTEQDTTKPNTNTPTNEQAPLPILATEDTEQDTTKPNTNTPTNEQAPLPQATAPGATPATIINNTVEIAPAIPSQTQSNQKPVGVKDSVVIQTKNKEEDMFDFGDEANIKTTSKAKKRPFDKYEEEPKMLPYFENIDGDFDISISSIITPQHIISPLVVNLDIDSGKFLLKRFMIAFNDTQIEMNASFTLDAEASIRGKMIAKNLPLNPIMKFFILECKTGGFVDADVKMYSKGRNLKTIIKNMSADINIDSKNLYTYYPNLSGMYSMLSTSQNITFLDLDAVTKQERRSDFKRMSGKIQIRDGIANGANISMVSVGYSGVFNFIANLSTSDIELAKVNFMVLGYKPWSKSFKVEDRFVNIPISLAASGSLSGIKYTVALERVKEYLSEIDKWKKESNAQLNQ